MTNVICTSPSDVFKNDKISVSCSLDPVQIDKYEIPAEIIGKITSKLDLEDVFRCRSICKKWKEVIEKGSKILMELGKRIQYPGVIDLKIQPASFSAIKDFIIEVIKTVKNAEAKGNSIQRLFSRNQQKIKCFSEKEFLKIKEKYDEIDGEGTLSSKEKRENWKIIKKGGTTIFHKEPCVQTVVDLNGKGLIQLPILQMRKFTNLRSLHLCDNNLDNLPFTLVAIKHLEELYLPRNKFKTIPKVIKSLRELKIFYIENNQIQIVPLWIRKLKKLKELGLRDNQIEDFPNKMETPLLEKLFLSNNNLGKVPEGIQGLGNLKELYLATNKIQEIPPWIGTLNKLQLLTFWNNQIKFLPKEIGELSNLKKLFLHVNQLEKLPEEINSLVNLEIFNCSDNSLKEIPSSFKLPKLKRFILYDNSLNDDSIMRLFELKKTEVLIEF